MEKQPSYGNVLFPVFLKAEAGSILLVGAGPVGLEKLTALTANMPFANIKIIAIDILEEVREVAAQFPYITIEQRSYESKDLDGHYMVIAAVNNRSLSEKIAKEAKQKGILVNVADTPDLCDFYLASIVKKGNLKIAISTNGKSPTMAKRLRQWLTDVLPDNFDPLLQNLYEIRNTIKGEFQEKVEKMDSLTSIMIEKPKR
jgi:siroheme synthase-like protein